MKNPYAAQQRNLMQNSKSEVGEGWALIELGRRLESARAETNREKVIEVVRLNWRVWTIIQSELVDPNNTLPIEIRQNLINLANFIDRRSVDIIADRQLDTSKLEVLININRNIGAGLLDNQNSEKQQAAQAPAPDTKKSDLLDNMRLSTKI